MGIRRLAKNETDLGAQVLRRPYGTVRVYEARYRCMDCLEAAASASPHLADLGRLTNRVASL